MSYQTNHYLLLLVLILSATLFGCSPVAEQQADESDSVATEKTSLSGEDVDFQLLRLTDFEVFHGKDPERNPTWTMEKGTIRCTGKPRGYLRSKKNYSNFTLRMEYRFPEFVDSNDISTFMGNTGVLIYITGDDKLWPKCLEVQGKYLEMATIKSNSRDVKIEVDDNPTARKQARKSPSEWNSIEITSKNGALTATLNGQIICRSQPCELTEGAIGFQAEDFPVEFRSIRLRPE